MTGLISIGWLTGIWKGESHRPGKRRCRIVRLQDNRRLGIATLGALAQHPRIAAFREFLEGWYLSYFTPDAARGLPMAGPQRRLSIHGDNLGNVVQYMEREHRDGFRPHLEQNRLAGFPALTR